MKPLCIFSLLLFFCFTTLSQDTTVALGNPVSSERNVKRQGTASAVVTCVGAGGLLVTFLQDLRNAAAPLRTLLTLGREREKRKSFTAPYVVFGAATVFGVASMLATVQRKKELKNVSGFLLIESTKTAGPHALRVTKFPAAGIRVRM